MKRLCVFDAATFALARQERAENPVTSIAAFDEHGSCALYSTRSIAGGGMESPDFSTTKRPGYATHLLQKRRPLDSDALLSKDIEARI